MEIRKDYDNLTFKMSNSSDKIKMHDNELKRINEIATSLYEKIDEQVFNVLQKTNNNFV